MKSPLLLQLNDKAPTRFPFAVGSSPMKTTCSAARTRASAEPSFVYRGTLGSNASPDRPRGFALWNASPNLFKPTTRTRSVDIAIGRSI